MSGTTKESGALSRAVSILSDIHFWVPVVVLIGGLLLLRFVR